MPHAPTTRTAFLAVGQDLVDSFASAVGCTLDVPTLESAECNGFGAFGVSEESHTSAADAAGKSEVLEKSSALVGVRWSSRTIRLRTNMRDNCVINTSATSLGERERSQSQSAAAVPSAQRMPAVLQERLTTIFLISTIGPVTSDTERVAASVTLGCAIDVNAAVCDFWAPCDSDRLMKQVPVPGGMPPV